MAAFWLDDGVAAIGARERAYQLYRSHRDHTSAARVAICLADDALGRAAWPRVLTHLGLR